MVVGYVKAQYRLKCDFLMFVGVCPEQENAMTAVIE